LVDGAIHDFTFGYLPWAMLTRLTGILPETAYSLTLSTLVALLALNAWLLVAVLVTRLRPLSRPIAAMASGLAGVVTVIGIGSWGMAQRIGASDWSLNFVGTPFDALRGLVKVVTGDGDVPDGAWRATTTWAETGTLQFPMLAYLTNEMAIQHLGLPLLLAALVVAIGFLSRPAPPAVAHHAPLATFGAWRELTPWFAIAGIVTGWTLATNPLFGGVVVLLTVILGFMASGTRAGWHSSWATLRDGGLVTLVYLAISGISIWPFLQMYGTFSTQREAVADSLATADFASFMGASLVIVMAALVLLGARALSTELMDRAQRGMGAIPVGLLVVAIGMAWFTGLVTVALLLLLMLVGLLIWFHHDSIAMQALLATVLVALMTCIASTRMEFINWSDQQNIPMQWFLASWVLFAVVAAVIVPVGCLALRDWARRRKSASFRLAPVATWGVAIVLVLSSAVYPAIGIPDQQRDRLVPTGSTLDAYAFMAQGQLATNAHGTEVAPYNLTPDRLAVDWMRRHLSGLPTILEAPATTVGGWGGRVSALTGYPTVIGSVPVELQQRPGMDRLVRWREADVQAIYGDSVPFADISPMLQDYGVQIIYVGPLERATYSADGLAKFDQAVTDGLIQELYNADGVSIYYFPAPRVSQEYRGER
jgi:uncharacterized membrane protein